MKIKAALCLAGLAATRLTAALPDAPVGLMCDRLSEPQLTVITGDRPDFSWIVSDPRRGAVQSAYQILVASSGAALLRGEGDVWDSGRVVAAQSVNVGFAATSPLAAGGRYFWKVRTWDAAGAASPYSAPQEIHLAGAGAPPAWANRYPLEKSEIPPVRFIRKAKGDYFIDFGRAAYGTVKLSLARPAPGASVQVCLGEVPAGRDGINSDPGGARRYRVMTVPLAGDVTTYLVAITPWAGNTHGAAIRMPAETGEVMPFRYCELLGVREEIGPEQIRQIAVHYHFDDAAGAFESSDPVLNAVWALCRYSIKATSFAGVYVDGDRERVPYEADAYIDQLGHYAVDREFSLARHTEDYLLDHATWPAEWQMHMPMMAEEDYLHTGNADLLARRYDELAAKTLVALERADGLVVAGAPAPASLLGILHLKDPSLAVSYMRPQEVVVGKTAKAWPLKPLTDWPPPESDGYEMQPVGAVTNAFHYRSLLALAEIAGALGKVAEEKAWTRRAERTRQAYQEAFFDPTSGTYRDGEGSQHHSLHGNMFPLAFGLVPPVHVSAVAAFVKSRGMACSVYGAQFLFEALYHAGEADAALALFTARGDRSWPHMIYDVGTTITLEAWDDKYKPNEDWNHAWGAAPANLIPRLLMGIEPLAPGFARFRVRPQTASLTHAALRLPTIRGPVTLAVDRPAAGIWTAALTVPANTVAELHVPASSAGQVTEGGGPPNPAYVRFLRREGGRLVFAVAAGTYRFEVTGQAQR